MVSDMAERHTVLPFPQSDFCWLPARGFWLWEVSFSGFHPMTQTARHEIFWALCTAGGNVKAVGPGSFYGASYIYSIKY